MVKDIAKLLMDKGIAKRRLSQLTLPSWLARIASYLYPELAEILHDLDWDRRCTSKKAQEQLGWKPRTRDESIIACAQSLQEFGFV